jgi:hypothetical protein
LKLPGLGPGRALPPAPLESRQAACREERNLTRSAGFEWCNTREGNHHESFNDRIGCGLGAVEHLRIGAEQQQFLRWEGRKSRDPFSDEQHAQTAPPSSRMELRPL